MFEQSIKSKLIKNERLLFEGLIKFPLFSHGKTRYFTLIDENWPATLVNFRLTSRREKSCINFMINFIETIMCLDNLSSTITVHIRIEMLIRLRRKSLDYLIYSIYQYNSVALGLTFLCNFETYI